mgnify:FL=1
MVLTDICDDHCSSFLRNFQASTSSAGVRRKRIPHRSTVLPKLCLVCEGGEGTKRVGKGTRRRYDQLIPTRTLSCGE